MTHLFQEPFQTPYESIPFSKIDHSVLLQNAEEIIEKAKQSIDELAHQKAAPTFENTMEEMEKIGQNISIISKYIFNLNNAETTPELQEIAKEVSVLLSKFSNYYRHHPQILERVTFLYKQLDTADWNPEQKRLVERKYQGLVRSGAMLDEYPKSELQEIENQLSVLGLEFNQNVLADTNAYVLHITDESELEGLPLEYKESAQKLAQEKELQGWAFTLQYPSFLPFVKYVDNRERRKEIYENFAKKGFLDNDHNNVEIISKIIELRQQKSEILGYSNYAEYVLEDRMAGSKTAVIDFLEDLYTTCKPFADKEMQDLKSFAQNHLGISDMKAYDHHYVVEKYRQHTFDLSEEELKPYFSLENSVNAVFSLAGKLFGLEFEENNEIEVYHPDVKVYEVKDSDSFIGLLYTDFFPRSGKKSGAWMTSFKEQYHFGGNEQRPHVSIVCNFSPPTDSKPSLLSFQEFTTLFHEMGHALHGILANTQYPSLSGTSVLWDFVELPSQFLENFCYEEEFLQEFAKHYDTQEPIPSELIQKIKETATFMEAYQTIRQLSFGFLDMAYHTEKIQSPLDIEAFENQHIERTRFYPHLENTCTSTAFAHIFAGGYASGYYSYKWAEVLDADAFAYFKEHHLWDTTIAQKYKALLQAGGSVEPMELYQNFRGKKPDSKSLLKRMGVG